MNDFISTSTVPKFHFMKPDPKDIHISDIAHALSLLCRFGGHCSSFYSVAEHSTILGDIAETAGKDDLTVMACLLHDAEEAYLPDIPRPIKAVMFEAQGIYGNLEEAIELKFRLAEADWDYIKDIDRRFCITEAKALGVWNEDWENEGEPLPHKLFLWSSRDAEELFLKNFILLEEKLYDYILRS